MFISFNVMDEKDCLHTICRKGHHKILQKHILNGKEDLNKEDERGLTPLHYACLKGHIKVAELLTTNGASSNVVTKK